MKNNNNKFFIKSGFPIFDLLAGGYPVGAYVVFKTLGGEGEQDALQRFLERQILRLSLPAPTGLGKRVLLLSAGMLRRDAAPTTSTSTTPDLRIPKPGSSPPGNS